MKANPAKGVSAPKAPRHLPKNIDVDDVNRLLDIDLNDPLAVRDRAMLEVMYGAGLRLSELVGGYKAPRSRYRRSVGNG